MIQFENNNYLYLTGIIPVLIIVWLINRRRQSKLTALLGEGDLVKYITIASPLFVQVLRYSLFLLSFLLLILSLGRPYVIGDDEHIKNITPTDIVFVVDVSKSMYVKDFAPDRLSRAKRVIKDVVSQLSNEQVGIVVFAGKANTYVPLTNDYYYVNKSVDGISADLVTQQGTSLHEALKISSLIYGADSKRTKIMCLISDGEFHDKESSKTADSLRKLGIKLFSFGLGTTTGGYVPLTFQPENDEIEKDEFGNPIISHLQPAELLRFVGNRNTNYFQVADKLNAVTLFMDQLKESEFNDTISSPKPYYGLFLIVALIFLLAETCIPQIVKAKKIS